jgi:ABC-type multidrug transport system fused ATPase/permease subunit
VVFSYPGSNEKVFNGLSLRIPAGKKVGIVGESGSGKTTLVGLAMGKYGIESESILIDGQDISKVTRQSHVLFLPPQIRPSTDSAHSIHEKMTRMDQTPFLFNCSVMENVRIARTEATDEEVLAACEKAKIHDAIMLRKHKYKTLMGEGGSYVPLLHFLVALRVRSTALTRFQELFGRPMPANLCSSRAPCKS